MILELITPEIGLSGDYIATIAKTASHRYKTYEIPKATGGVRTIDHPARELKLLQSWLVHNLISRLPVHTAAYAYRSGRNILTHASLHASRNFLLKVDFKDFFPSITGSDVSRVFERNSSIFSPVMSADDYTLVRSLVCKNDRLTIGAPSSPALSNAVMFEFDTFWAQRCLSEEVVYSRYADDLYFSTNRPSVLSPLFDELRADLSQRASPKLFVNDRKTAFTSRKRRRLVTGLVLGSDHHVSIGRAAKRKLKSQIFRYIHGIANAEEKARLQGLISYARSVDPGFFVTLRRKYGTTIGGLF